MPVTKTRRMVTTGGLEWRSDSSGVTLEGHASTFNQAYDMGWYYETVAPGAFTRTLNAKPDVRLLINHEGLPLARTLSGTLDLAQDDSGLYMRSVLDPNDPDVQRIVPKMQRGDLNEMSFAFSTVKDEWSKDYSSRILRELSLAGGDVSVVTYPANPNATVSMRSKILESVDVDRLRSAYAEIVEESRAGDTLTADASWQLAAILESLAVADTYLDSSLVALSKVLGVANPDEGVESEVEDEAARAAAAELEQTRVLSVIKAARTRFELLRH